MRKNQGRSTLSPTNKLQLKSPPSRLKSKISSPIHSYRPSSNRNKRNSLKKRAESNNSNIIWLPSPTLYAFFHPLERIKNVQQKFHMSLSNKVTQKIRIISSIDVFSDTYMELNDQMKVECQKWYIISNAVNCQQTEQQFNQLYAPLEFMFLPSISSACNQVLGFNNNVVYRDIVRIYDFSLSSGAEFLCVQELSIENLVIAQENCIYLLSDSKQWMNFSTKLGSFVPYFITGNEQFRNGKLSSMENDRIKSGIVLICLQFQRKLNEISGFKEYEAQFRNRIASPAQISKISNKNEIYLSKIIQKLIILDPSNICIFHDSLVKYPLLQISEIRQKLTPAYYFFQSSLYCPADNAYRLKFNSHTRNCQELTLNTALTIADQLHKIEHFITAKNNLIQAFTPHIDILKKMQIYFYLKDKENQSERAKGHRHCITSVLERCGVKVVLIGDLENLLEISKITIIYGCFSFAEIKSVNRFYNVFLVPLSKQPQEIATFNQIPQAITFIDTVLKSYSQLYSEPQTQAIQAFIHVLYEEQTQLPPLLEILSVPEHLLKTHYIPNFHRELPEFHENSKHLIISPMDIFSEVLQAQIRQFQWKCNTVSIDMYLQYGREFIFRNKEGAYKFIKAVQLQAKIKQLEDYYKVVAKEASPNINQESTQIKGKQVCLKGLEEVQQMKIQEGELQNLGIEESIVSQYANNKLKLKKSVDQNQQKQLHDYGLTERNEQEKQEGSFIKLLTDSIVGPSEKVIGEQQNQKGKGSQLIGLETKKIIGSSNIEIYNKNDYELSANLTISKSSVNDPVVKALIKQKRPKQKELPSQPATPVVAHKKKSKEKSSYIKQFKQHKPMKFHSNAQIQQQLQVDQLNNLKSTNAIGPEFYKLYIFIHRSVPLHSLARRHQKQYHVLVYTRLEEILVFARYLKEEEKIVVIANEQSQQIYGQLIQKSKASGQRFKIIFNRDLSQNYIRNQVDKILHEERLQQLTTKTVSKRFKALIVYSANNERVQKAIKIVRKIFGMQIKLLFLKEKEYEQMTQSKFKVKINSSVVVYKIGLNAKQNQVAITSIRSLFILAMHPDLKSFGFQLSQLQFSYQSYLGRALYGNSQKNYILANKTIKVGDALRKKVQGMKSETNFHRMRESNASHLRTDHSERRISQTPRRSSVSRSSTVFRTPSSISIISSLSLKEFYTSKNSFTNQQDLLSHIFVAYSHSKLAIVVLTQKQFDMFDLFQSQYFQEVGKQVIWVIETKTEGKLFFVGPNIVYATTQNIKQAVESIIKEYEAKVYFEDIQINSQSLKPIEKKVNSEQKRTLQLIIAPKISAKEEQEFKIGYTKNKILLTLANQKRKYVRNVIQLPNVESIKAFSEFLVRKFNGETQIEQSEAFASLLLVNQKSIQKLSKIVGPEKKSIMFKTYNPENLVSLVNYSLLRTLIIIEKESPFKCIQKCPFMIQIDKNSQKASKLIVGIVI